MSPRRHTCRSPGVWCSYASARVRMTMEPRFNLFDSQIAMTFAKRIHGAGMAVEQSTLPKATRELVMLRISQINGCAPCVDIPTKEATAAGETPLRLSLVAVWPEALVGTEAARAALALPEDAPGSPTPPRVCPTRPGPRCASTTTTTRSAR